MKSPIIFLPDFSLEIIIGGLNEQVLQVPIEKSVFLPDFSLEIIIGGLNEQVLQVPIEKSVFLPDFSLEIIIGGLNEQVLQVPIEKSVFLPDFSLEIIIGGLNEQVLQVLQDHHHVLPAGRNRGVAPHILLIPAILHHRNNHRLKLRGERSSEVSAFKCDSISLKYVRKQSQEIPEEKLP